MIPDDLDHLERWYDGTLDEAGRARWHERLQRDAALQAEVAAELRLARGLAALSTPEDQRRQRAREAAQRTRMLLSADTASRRRRTVSGVMTRAGRRLRTHRWMVAAVAAAAACLGVALLWPTTDAVAWGDGLALRTGAEVPASVRALRFADGSTVDIAPDSRLRLTGDRARKALALEAGRVSATVAPQPSDGGFAVTTEHGVASVRGTRFTVSLLPGGTLLAVDEGRVHLDAVGGAADVQAGERALATGGVVEPLPPLWRDRRPLGRVVLSQSPGNGPDRNGWLIGGQPGTGASFAERMSAHVDQAIAALKRIDAQGLLLYTIEGGTHQQSAGFVGDPRRIADFAPEFDAVADAVFARIRAAGLATGVTVTPWRLERVGDTWRQVADPATAETELEAKVAYARRRWGCSLFYLNVASPGVAADVTMPPSALRTVLRRHPEVLFIIERATPDLDPLGGVQVLGREPAGSAEVVVRLPWFATTPTQGMLSSSLAAGEILLIDPLAAEVIDQLREAHSTVR